MTKWQWSIILAICKYILYRENWIILSSNEHIDNLQLMKDAYDRKDND